MKMRTEYNPSDYAPSLVFVRIYATILKTITTQYKNSGDNSMRGLDLDMDYFMEMVATNISFDRTEMKIIF